MSVPSYNFSFIQKKEFKQKLLIIIVAFAMLLMVLQFIILFLLCPLFITSSSMEPGIEKNSAIFVTPLAPDRPVFFNTNTLERGSVVYINSLYPSNKTTFQKTIDFIFGIISFQQYRPYENVDGKYSEIYRVVGLPEDTLYIKDFVAYIQQSGASHFLTEFELSALEYDISTQNIPNNWDMSIGLQGNTEQIVLKHDEYFLLCDNRLVAVDSRLFGPVKEELISGRALLQYFPLTNMRVF